jgi:hypothetical protein
VILAKGQVLLGDRATNFATRFSARASLLLRELGIDKNAIGLPSFFVRGPQKIDPNSFVLVTLGQKNIDASTSAPTGGPCRRRADGTGTDR